MKVVCRIPGKQDIVFGSYEDLNNIWLILEQYKDVELFIKKDKEDEEIKVNESIDSVEAIEQKVTLKYEVPKSVTFTQRFQDRVRKEMGDILDTVYPHMFSITDIYYKDIEDNIENMNMFIVIQVSEDEGVNVEEAIHSLTYLDNNVEYILKDTVNYYI